MNSYMMSKGVGKEVDFRDESPQGVECLVTRKPVIYSASGVA